MKPSREQIAAAIRIAQTALRWKPDSAARHLAKRVMRGHLPPTATIHDYEQIIQAVIHSSSANVYIFSYEDTPYVTIVDFVNQNCWLVMFDLSGILESAYIVERPEHYLRKETVEFVDLLEMVLR